MLTHQDPTKEQLHKVVAILYSRDARRLYFRVCWLPHLETALICSRFLIACVIASVGTRFLASTDNLHDIIVNSTALGSIIEVRARFADVKHRR